MDHAGVARLVLGNPRLRRVILAFAAFNFADWARWLAILIYAFERGGAAEAGAISLLQLVPAAIVAPLAASLADRVRRDRVLLLSYVTQATFMVGMALAIIADAPSALVYGAAVAGACAITLTRPAHGSLLPSIARTPAELTAANAASGTMEGLGILAGQASAGIVVQLAGPAAALIGAGGVAALAAASIVGLGIRPLPAHTSASPVEPRPTTGLVTELLGGLAAVVHLPGPRTVVLLLGASALVWGALDVLIVVLTLDLTTSGASSAGLLNAAAGIGGLMGATLALGLAGRLRLALPFAIGILAWGMPLIAIGIVPVPIIAAGLLLIGGAGRTVQDVVGRTLLQRTTPDAVLGRVLGVVEGVFMAAFGLGAIAVSALVALVGAREAFVLSGLLLPAAVFLAWRALRALDASSIVPVREIALLRGIPLFSPLAPPVLERLALHLEPVEFDAGGTIIRQGDAADRLYVLAAGEVDVRVDGRLAATQGPGTEFGEIALLRDVPRTATVTALTHVDALTLPRHVFLDVVAGHADTRAAADEIVSERLGETTVSG